MCLLIRTVSQVSDEAHGPLVDSFFDLVLLGCVYASSIIFIQISNDLYFYGMGGGGKSDL